MKRKVDVALLGHRFTVRTEKDEASVHTLAAQVTRRIEDLRRSMRNLSREEATLLVALQLAEEIADERERAAGARAEIRRHTEAMVAKLSAALLPEGSVDDESGEVALAAVHQRQV